VGRIAHELRLHAEFERAGLVHAGRTHGKDRPRSSTGTGSTAGSGRGSRHGNGGGPGRGASGRKVASARPNRRSGRR
jgi:hypothetical protein